MCAGGPLGPLSSNTEGARWWVGRGPEGCWLQMGKQVWGAGQVGNSMCKGDKSRSGDTKLSRGAGEGQEVGHLATLQRPFL
jgi:hypothetical protein